MLFRLSTSNLSETEAAEIENLISILNMQKPVFKVANVFVLGTRLLAYVRFNFLYLSLYHYDTLIIEIL